MLERTHDLGAEPALSPAAVERTQPRNVLTRLRSAISRPGALTPLGKLFRTTAFRLTLVYLTIFALFAAFLLAYFALNSYRLITEQISQVVEAEITGLSEQYRLGGIRRLVFVIENRTRRPGSSLYLVTTYAGEALAGNVAALQPDVLNTPGIIETTYKRLDDSEGPERHALARVVQLPGGFRDLSGRLPVGRTGDELDRLAQNLNEMLERIEALMRGLQEVSDNIAHDLKTPLTRLRNRAEQALRTASREADYRAALEATIEESDGLIGTFNALLMIARAESGHAREGMAEFDAAEIARDIGELYEPLAEEKGSALRVEAPPSLPARGNRELVSQALANLVDNAIKYSAPGKKAAGASAEIVVQAREQGDGIELSVADRGPGIPVEDRGRAVERFVRLEQSRSQPGSGLGLSLAAAVARLHHGNLRLEDNQPGLKSVLALPRGGPVQGAG